MKNNVNSVDKFLGGNFKIHSLPIMLAVFTLLSVQCSPVKSLSENEKAKLDTPLLHLLSGDREDERRLDITYRADGTKEYAVIVQSENPEAIRELGINISSVFGDIIVVHATLEELKIIVSISTVNALRTGSKRKIQQN